MPPFGASFCVDALAIVMAVLAGYLTLSAGWFAGGYLTGGARSQGRFRAWLTAFVGVCLGVVLSADWLTFLVFWELLTLVVYFLLCYSDRKAALRYCVVQIAGAGLLSVGIARLYVETGSLVMGPVPGHLAPFFVVGIGVKAGLLGLHFWLPDVHSRAPAPVSSLLSGYVVKLGAYALIRISAGPDGFILWAGGLMALYGVVFALLQHDAKRLLAYSTVSQVGYIVAAIGAGSEFALAAAAYHMVTHALFKGLLFLSIGAVESDFGTRDLRFLGGVGRLRPLTFASFLVGAAAIAGLPGTSGFASKVAVKYAVEGHEAINLALMAAGAGTAISFARLAFYAFLGDTSRLADNGRMTHARPSGALALPRNAGMLMLAAATVFIGFRPGMLPAFLGVPAPPFFASGNVVAALVTVLAGLLGFAAFKGVLYPRPKSVPDIDRLTDAMIEGLALVPTVLRTAHSGSTRFYAFWTVATVIVLLCVL
ncbi:MAG: proton-conducting transporter membrane subunit [Bacillota bacterium]